MPKIQSELESIPHLCQKVCAIWGSPELEAYIEALMMDSRDGSRKGLPVEIGAELLWLAEINKLRRAVEMSEKLGIGLDDASAKIDRQAASRVTDIWENPGLTAISATSNGRRYTDKPLPVRPRRRNVERTAFGIVYVIVTSKFFLGVLVFILTVKILWRRITVLL